MKVLFATTNPGKIAEVKQILPNLNVEIFSQEVPEVKSVDPIETIVEKAKAAFLLAKKPILVDDTCLFFNAFNGFPGTYTKFAVGTVGLENLIMLLEGKDSSAYFLASLGFAFEEKGEVKVKVFQGRVDGKIVPESKGFPKHGLPYDYVFVPDGFEKTFAELEDNVKNLISHRGKALRQFEKWAVENQGLFLG